MVYLHAPDAWEDLEVLLRYKFTLEIVVIKLQWHDRTVNQEAHERLPRRLRYRLGVWDHRETMMRHENSVRTWDFFVQRTEQDPNDLSHELQLLFAENRGS